MRTHPPTTPHHTKPHEISPVRNQIRLILFQIIKYPHPLLDAQSCSKLLTAALFCSIIIVDKSFLVNAKKFSHQKSLV